MFDCQLIAVQVTFLWTLENWALKIENRRGGCFTGWIFSMIKVQDNPLILKCNIQELKDWKMNENDSVLTGVSVSKMQHLFPELKTSWWLKKDIRSIENKHTVLCLQTIGVCEQRTVCLFSIDRMFFFNQEVVSNYLNSPAWAGVGGVWIFFHPLSGEGNFTHPSIPAQAGRLDYLTTSFTPFTI